MERNRIKSFNKQLSRMYSLLILHIILSIAGLMLNYLRLKSDYMYFSILFLNVCAVIFFEPWKIISYLNEGYGYQEGMKVISKTKGEK